MTDLEALGYYFDAEGVLRTKEDNKTFQFTTQEDYEKLGAAVDLEVYKLLEERCGLIRKPLKPQNSKEPSEDCSFIFCSKNSQKAEKLLVLIHGSGVVRAGQWARRLIINENLECGTQIPYIERALENGWGVVVMNTNLNETADQELKYSTTPTEHASNVWKWWVEPSGAHEIYVVAHSRGGYDASCVLKKYGDDKRISKICLTDSSFQVFNSYKDREEPLFIVNFLAGQNFSSPRYEVEQFENLRVQELYAGTKIHEWSSHCSIDAVFHILENEITPENYVEVLNEAKKLVLRDSKSEENEPKVKKSRVED